MGPLTTGRQRRSHLYWQVLFFGLVVSLLFVVLRGLGAVLTPVAAALVLSYLLDPIVTWMEKRLGWPRWVGTLVLFLTALLILGALLLLVVPLLVREIHSFAEAVPGYATRIRGTVVPWVERSFGLTVPRSLSELADGLGADMRGVASRVLAPLQGVAGTVAVGTASLIFTIATLLLVPVFTFYFLPAFPGIVRGAEDLIPRRYLAWVQETAREVDRVLAAWIRGQITVMCILTLYYSVALWVVGIKMAVLIGLLTGFLAFIPYVGVVVGVSFALLVALLEYHGPGQVVGVAVVFGLAQVVDGLFLTPVLVGERVGLGPVGVLLALMLGGHFFGFTGVLLAVPTAAALVVVLKRGVAAYRATHFYHKGPAAHEAAGEFAEGRRPDDRVPAGAGVSPQDGE
jgi:predicted PurR-regulated permease PerM